jgi:hypothetical protein
MTPFKEQLEAMIEMYDYVSVARIYLSDDAAVQFASARKLWRLWDKENDTNFLWNGKGEDPRVRKRAQQDPKSK